MKIVFMGTPEFSVPILEALNEKYDVCLVVSQPDSLVGRKKVVTYSPVKQKALELGIEVFQPINIKQDNELLKEYKDAILITAAYGQIVPTSILEIFKYQINVHASLLPKYRGGAPIQRSIINGDKKTGVTIMQMVKKMDAGVIYAVKELDILDADNNESLFAKLSIIGRDLLLDSLEDIVSGENKGVSQDEYEVTYAPNIKREEELIDFNKTSREVFNQIRGLSINPGAYAFINGQVIKVYSSNIVEDGSCNIAGSIISLKKEILVKTLDGAISLIDIKPQGKKLMSAKDFVNGQKIFNVGDIFNAE